MHDGDMITLIKGMMLANGSNEHEFRIVGKTPGTIRPSEMKLLMVEPLRQEEAKGMNSAPMEMMWGVVCASGLNKMAPRVTTRKIR